MFTITGNYASADIMTDKGVEGTAMSQIYNILNHPLSDGTKIAIMPDVHAGMGCVIGFTQTLSDKICPNLIGVDIGCGIDGVNLGPLTNEEIDFPMLDAYIRDNIPSGFNIQEKDRRISPLKAVSEGIDKIAEATEQDPAYVRKSIGTLGGGNHFIELNRAENDDVWLVVHTGSRNFGLKICKWFQKKAHTGGGQVSRELAYLEGEDAQGYLDHMRVAQGYAKMNRSHIQTELLVNYFADKGPSRMLTETIETTHNYIGDDNIVRKGAIQANEGQRVLIPMNMRDGTIVATGKGKADWNYSAPHGAGRLMSRGRAKKKIKLEDFREQMSDVWSSCVKKSTLDEAPDAYKPKEELLEALSDSSVDIDFIMKPIYNFKG